MSFVYTPVSPDRSSDEMKPLQLLLKKQKDQLSPALLFLT
jgi:hypothetical protein